MGHAPRRFWHPQYAYERTRQALILLRSLLAYRESLGVSWPIIIAGDFNTQPKETVYHLITRPKGGLSEGHEEEVGFSRAVHDSLGKVEEGIRAAREKATGRVAPEKREEQEKSVNGEAGAQGEEEEGGEADEEDDEEDEEKTNNTTEPIPTDRPKGTRHCVPSDGLLTAGELQSMAQEMLGERGVRSAYADTNWLGKQGERKGLSYAGRGGEGDLGGNEPGWTSFTP
jgi:RNA exonuclease NGL2